MYNNKLQEMDNAKKICDIILEDNHYVRYVTICDREGNILGSSKRSDVNQILSDEETRKSLKRAVDSWHSRDEFVEKLGNGRFAVVGYDNLVRITIPLKNERLLLVTLDGNKPYSMGEIFLIIQYVENLQL